MARMATDEEFAELRALAREYEELTGRQGYLYCSQPERVELFHFGTSPIERGIDRALMRQRALLIDARAGKH